MMDRWVEVPTLTEALTWVKQWGLQSRPREACGIVVRRSNERYFVWQMPNFAEGRTEYVIDSAMVAATVSEETFYNNTWVWHTHPGGQVGPSRGDIESQQLGVQYMVMTLPRGEVFWYGWRK